eukprot:SAG11_NODE_22834_length_399_cov_0.990000_1_plen_55_part_10
MLGLISAIIFRIKSVSRSGMVACKPEVVEVTVRTRVEEPLRFAAGAVWCSHPNGV